MPLNYNRKFSSLLVGTRSVPSSLCALGFVSLLLSGGAFPSIQNICHMQVLSSSLLNTWENLLNIPADLFLCLISQQLSPLQYSIPWTLTIVVSSDSQFLLLKSGWLLGLLGSPFLPSLQSRNFSKNNLGKTQSSPFSPYLGDHYPMLPYFQYLKKYCSIYFVQFISCSRKEGKSIP